MEDPWGSPWATTDAPTPKIDLPAAPPSAHFSVESAGSSQKTVQNPWEDGDAWGGWNDRAAAAGTPGVGRKRSGVFDSPGWGGLSPAAQPAKVPTSRGVSPDPWRLSDGRMSDGRRSVSRERSFQELKRKSDASLGMGSEGVGADRLSASNAFGLQNVWEPPPLAAEGSTDRVSLNGKAVGLDRRPEPSIATTAGIAAGSPGATAVSASESPSILSEQSSITSEAQSISRPESPVGNPPGPAIPGGADDEDPDQNRKVSTKVQGLVDMYDGISRNASRNASPNIGATSPRTPTGISMTTLLSRPELQVTDQDSDVPSGKDATQADEEAQPTEGSDAPRPPSHTITDEEATLSSSIPASRPKQHSRVQSIDFHVDMTNLDDLFPTTPPITVAPEQVPDVIIKDSFTSISERKTWYRISRLGAMRMHQLGDEENYVRVDWKRSAARQDTLKIVRRWMEEESGGRPTLGRKVGAIGGSVFNWNSSAPPVEIGELLRKRGPHSKAGSSASRASGILSPATAEFSWGTPPVSPGISNRPPPSPAVRTNESGARASASSRPQSMVLPRAAPPPSSPGTQTSESGAGPGTSTRPQSMVLPRAPPPPSDSSAEFAEPPKIQPVPIITRSLDVANRPSIDQTLSKPVPTPTVVNGSRGSFSDDKDASDDDEDEDDGEDDDWGDMVTSPTAETSPWPSSAPTHTWPVGPVKVSTDIKETKNASEDTSLDKSKDEIISPGWPTVVSAQTWPVAEVNVSTNIREDSMKLLESVSPDKSRDEIVSPGWPTVGPTITWPVAAVKITTNIEEPKKLPGDTSADKSKDEIISPGWPTVVPTPTWPVPDVKIKISTNVEETKTLPDDTLPDESKDEIVSPGVWPTLSQQAEDPAPATFGDMGLQPTGTGMVAPQHPLSVPKQKPRPRPLASLDSALAWTGEPLNSPALSPLLMESPPPPPPPKSPRSFATTEPNQALFASEEETATGILGNLPDLSYMLR
ncbi:unnamed protein product [Clonostachys solani]|uniref:Uncharacterized protein n=1 Tax=Clonostachys solani TaxID=160281 RepID=A0A9P0EPT4_9HYPO|nr:unnamed protein product [Clonostachys solani]